MNKKLGEHILHFLFVCIDRDKASKVFRDCWPLLDKRQESQFYKATFEWYKSLQQVRCFEDLTPICLFVCLMAPQYITSIKFLFIRIAFSTYFIT